MGLIEDIGSRIGSSGGTRVKAVPLATITGLGKKRLEQPGTPDTEWTILNQLSEGGAMSTRDISNRTGLSMDKTKALLRQMEREGFIQRASRE